jgi:hypothetical protein
MPTPANAESRERTAPKARADYGNLNAIEPGIAEILSGISQEDNFNFENFYAQLSANDRGMVDRFRKNTRPNSFAILSDYQFPDDEVDFELGRGGGSTCPDQVIWE